MSSIPISISAPIFSLNSDKPGLRFMLPRLRFQLQRRKTLPNNEKRSECPSRRKDRSPEVMMKDDGAHGETGIRRNGKPGACPNYGRPPEKRPPFSFLTVVVVQHRFGDQNGIYFVARIMGVFHITHYATCHFDSAPAIFRR